MAISINFIINEFLVIPASADGVDVKADAYILVDADSGKVY